MDPPLPANTQRVGPSSDSAQMPPDMREQERIPISTESRELALSTPSPPIIELRQKLANANAKIQDLRRLVNEVKAAERRAQNDLKKTKDDWSSYYQTTLQELERTKEVLNQTQRDKKEWETKAGQSENQLDACQNTLFNLRPADKKTDSQICDDWKELCVRICNWIDNDSGDKEGPVISSKRLKDADCNMKSIEHYWGPDRLHLADQYPGILEHLVCYNIHELLYEEIFREDADLLGLSPNQTKMINSVEQGLKILSPQRDPSSIDLWKSEAMNAMSIHPNFDKRQSKAAEKMVEKAQSFLAPVLPGLDHGGLISLYKDVIEAAIHLATNMRLSTKSYHFSFAMSPDSHMASSSPSPLTTGRGKLSRSDSERYHVRDLGTGKRLKPNQSARDARDDIIGERILLVEPALRRRRRGAEDVVLQRPLVLAQLSEPPRGSSSKLTAMFKSVMG